VFLWRKYQDRSEIWVTKKSPQTSDNVPEVHFAYFVANNNFMPFKLRPAGEGFIYNFVELYRILEGESQTFNNLEL
jgi:hypothetical protein